MEENLHEGHRKRVRDKFLADGFPVHAHPHEVLEMLLFYSIPRGDTNEIAHRLIKKFGTLANVLEAPIDELLSVKGMGENCVAHFKLILDVVNRYEADASSHAAVFRTSEEIGTYLLGRFAGVRTERMVALSLNANGRLKSFDIVSDGTCETVGIRARDVVHVAIKTKPNAMVLAHNHPGGLALPSRNDVEATINIQRILKSVGIVLLDHIVISDGDYVSMVQCKEFHHIFAGGEPLTNHFK